VVKVLLCSHLPAANDVSPSPWEEPLLAVERVHHIGQPIFLVIARSHVQARAAARQCTIDYNEEEPVLSIDDALRMEQHFEAPLRWQSGDADAAIREAEHALTGRLEMGGQDHFYLEGQVALAVPGEDGTMLIQSSTQHPTEIQHKVADTLGVEMHDVRVETRRMGGGFGGKESQANAPACAAAIAARITGRPCKMRYDRDDDMMITGKRHDARIDYRVGFDRTGRLKGVEFTQYIRGGWSLDLTLPVADRAMLHADNCYHIPAMTVESHRLRTNTQSATAFRGFGGPQGMLGIERVMDHVAHTLAIDPLLVRQRNFYAPMHAGEHHTSHYGMLVDDCVIDEITDSLLVSSDYKRRRAEIASWNSASPILKRGIALTPVKFGISFTLTHYNQAGALVHVYQDGSISINHGGTEMGQGLYIKVAQIAADAFGQPLKSIRITAADTAKVPNTSATAASSGTDLNGMATKIACDRIMQRLIDCVANEHQIDADEVRIEDGRFVVGSEQRTFRDVVRSAYQNRVSLSANGFYATPGLHWDRRRGQGRPFFYFAYGAAVSE
ncbi:MAG: molybdopterin-dependent oxidoreductase, partial [Rhodobacteraceae bacterium]|nr:molybdopterin-dependent oxidoreductase [Paracoccaceae bacterium]